MKRQIENQFSIVGYYHMEMLNPIFYGNPLGELGDEVVGLRAEDVGEEVGATETGDGDADKDQLGVHGASMFWAWEGPADCRVRRPGARRVAYALSWPTFSRPDGFHSSRQLESRRNHPARARNGPRSAPSVMRADPVNDKVLSAQRPPPYRAQS